MQDGFSAPQVAQLAGITYDSLDYWVTHGVLSSSLQAASGKGTRRRFSFRDVVAAKLAKELRDGGASLQAIRAAVEYVRREHQIDDPLAETRLIVSGDDVMMVHDDQSMISALRQQGQGAFRWVIDVDKIVADLQEAIKKAA